MKLYFAYKKQFSLILFGILLTFLLVFPIVFSHAETTEELQDKINQKNTDINKLEQEIKVFQTELSTLDQQKSSLSGSLKQLDVTRKKLNADISVTQNKVDKTDYRIDSLASEIGNKQDAISNNIDVIALGIRAVDEFERSTMLEAILSGDNFTTAWNDIDNVITIREKLRENIIELQNIKNDLENTKKETTVARNELQEFKSDLDDQKEIVDQNATEKNKLLSQTKNSEANFQKLLKEQLQKKLAIEKELRDYESQLKFILDPSALPSGGVLSWPLDQIFVTQEFGAKTGPHRYYTNGHGGTDFRARTPLKTYAMADGVVLGTGNTDITCPKASFGQWVLIQYNNGLSSTHAHLSLIKVVKGQQVKRGEVIGYTGGTGNVTAPHLHISLYVSSAAEIQTLPSISCLGKTLTQPVAPINAYLDPMYYLPPYSPQ